MLIELVYLTFTRRGWRLAQLSSLFFIDVYVADLQYYIIFRVYNSASIFLQIMLYFKFLQNDGYIFLCYTIYPRCLSILYIVVRIS